MNSEPAVYETAKRIVAYRRAIEGHDQLAVSIENLGMPTNLSANLFDHTQDPRQRHHRNQYQSLFENSTAVEYRQHGYILAARRDTRTIAVAVDDTGQATVLSRSIDDTGLFTGPMRFTKLTQTDPLRAAAYWISGHGPTSVLRALN